MSDKFSKMIVAISMTLLLAMVPLIGIAQVENHPTSDAAGITVHRHLQASHAPMGPTEELRIRPKNRVEYTARHADGTVFYHSVSYNLRTNAGGDYQSAQMGGSASTTTCQYIGLASDSSNSNVGTVAATDTVLSTSGTGSTEYSTLGLSRAVGSYTLTSHTQFTISKTFTASGSATNVNKSGLFASATGVSGTPMCFEDLFTAVSLSNLDTLAITWTINY